MFRNVANQAISALILGTDGSPVTTGTTTVYYCLDNGTYGTGTTATHKGGGLWGYAPPQAQTDGAHAAFVFSNDGTAALKSLVQCYTTDYESSVRMTAAAKGLVYGTCGNGTTPTTSFIPITGGSGGISPSVVDADQYKGRILTFLSDTTSTGLRGEGAPIFSVTTAGITLGTATAGDQTLTRAPTNGDSFTIA
jgi:hypothetical protein